jgi:hypothetical protein
MESVTRTRSRLAILVLAGLLVIGVVAALASASSNRTSVAVTFKYGPEFPVGATRFDGAYVGSLKRVYFLGFRAADNSTDGSVWYYDTAAKTYTDTGVDMPVPVSNYQIAALSDSKGLGLYIFGGRDNAGNIVTTVQAFYPDTSQTRTINGDPWPGTTPAACVSLPGMGVAVVNNMAVVMGGASFSANGCADDNSAQTWIFDPKGASGSRWTQGPDLKMARGYVTPAVFGKKIFAIGGDVNDAGTLIPQSIVEAWTFGGTSWNNNKYADLPETCDESQAFAFKGGLLASTITLAGCGQWPNALPDVLQYDIAGNSWSTVGALKDARRNQAGAVLSASKNKMYVLGGYNSDGSVTLSTSEFGKPAAAADDEPDFPGAPAAPSSSGGSVFTS